MNADDVARMRNEYGDVALDVNDMADNPMAQFAVWFSEATSAEVHESNAFVLATADAKGQPSARAVLMKEFTDISLLFYTNLESHKSVEMRENPAVAATFVWTPIHRQVRFEGRAIRVDDGRADAYFASRPRGAQVAAHASNQSQIADDRETLENVFNEMNESFGETVPRPETWGGWEIVAETVEFWQGRTNRLHDRIRYRRSGEAWEMERLQP